MCLELHKLYLDINELCAGELRGSKRDKAERSGELGVSALDGTGPLPKSLGFSRSSIGMDDAMENTATMTVNHTSPVPLSS
jgi:hypothetical protein